MNSILSTVNEFYQRSLTAEADYLASHGITSNDALKAFGCGYASGGLTKLLPKDQFPILKEAGLVDKSGRNRFKASLTFALTDLEGNLTDIMGHNLGKASNIKTIHDKALGVGNTSCLKATDEVIVTDHPLEALKLYQEGHRNVLLVPDVHAASMLKARKVTVLSYRNPDKLAKAIQAEEIWFGHINGKDSSPVDSLKRIKCLKSVSHTDILNRVVKDLNTLGYVGESRNKKLAYLVAISRKLSHPLSAIIVSSSGAGKTGLMNAIGKLVPGEDKLFLSRLTPQALYYMPKGALVGKLLVIDERNGSSMADYSIRTAQTSHVLTLARPKGKGSDDGVITISVRCSYMESTTSHSLNPENASRCFILHLDESPQATQAVLEAQRIAKNGTQGISFDNIISFHHNHQKAIKSYPVSIPFADKITFPCHKVTYRREQEKFLSLIQASALLHQNDRQIVEGVLLASPEDYAIAYDLFISIFEDMQREVSLRAMKLLKILESEKVITFSVRKVLSLTGWPYSSLKRTLKELLDYEYILRDHSKKGQKQSFTRLDYSIYGKSIGRLTHPDELLSTTCPSVVHEVSTSESYENPSRTEVFAEPVHLSRC